MPAWVENIIPGLINGGLTSALLLTIGYIFTRLTKKQDARTAQPPKQESLWDRVDRLDKIVPALVMVVEDLVDGWPKDAPKPVIRRRATDVLVKYEYLPNMPDNWLTKEVSDHE